jgi:hypothetical protein
MSSDLVMTHSSPKKKNDLNNLIQVTVHHHPNTNEEIVLSTKER